jgi:hypothetical protein
VPPYIPACDRTFALPTNSGKPAHEVLLRRVALLSGKSDGCSVRLDAAAARLESAGSTAACLPKRKRKLAPKLPTRRHVACPSRGFVMARTTAAGGSRRAG